MQFTSITGRRNIQISTPKNESPEPPRMIMKIFVIVRPEPVMNTDAEKEQAQNPPLHIRTLSKT
jgi:hypothetical protein